MSNENVSTPSMFDISVLLVNNGISYTVSSGYNTLNTVRTRFVVHLENEIVLSFGDENHGWLLSTVQDSATAQNVSRDDFFAAVEAESVRHDWKRHKANEANVTLPDVASMDLMDDEDHELRARTLQS